jgi:membrane fusion protein, multidrug efflux system
MKKRRGIVVVVLAGIAIVIVLRVSSAGEPTHAVDAPVVRQLGAADVEVAALGMVESGVGISGSLEPHREAEVRAQLAGTVDRVLVDRGTRVGEGALLALYDASAVRSQLAGAEAAVAAARAAVASADRDEEAAETLYEVGAIAERALRQARSSAAGARAELMLAEARLAEVRQTDERTRITAPLGGVVSRRGVSPGEAVSPGQPLFTVVATDTLELAARVPAHELARVAVGKPVVVSIDAFPGRRFEGSITRIDPVAEAATRQVTVYARIPNDTGELVGGLHATGRILHEAAAPAVTVAHVAIRGGDDATHVLVVEGDTIARRSVELGPRDDTTGRVAVRAGLEAGALVVIGPAAGLEPGSRVRIRGGSPEAQREALR